MSAHATEDLDSLLQRIRACRICVETPRGAALPHAPRPVLRAHANAGIGIFGQAPGTRVHASGMPFTDPSGDRLREWLGVTSEEFYDETRVAIVPMGFCFPGLDAKGADRPPRRECAPAWRAEVLAALPRLELALLVGGYAQAWHLGTEAGGNVSATVARWREFALVPEHDTGPRTPKFWPLPHPSWRNSGWLKRNPWFAAELLPALRADVRRVLDRPTKARAGAM